MELKWETNSNKIKTVRIFSFHFFFFFAISVLFNQIELCNNSIIHCGFVCILELNSAVFHFDNFQIVQLSKHLRLQHFLFHLFISRF